VPYCRVLSMRWRRSWEADTACGCCPVLQLAGLDRSGPKKSALDEYMIGSTDAGAIIDAKARSRREHRDPLDALLDHRPVTELERQAAMVELEREVQES
jgi:hypothetical protein